MDEQLRLLVDIQKLDSRIITKQARVHEIPQKISTMEQPLKEAREELKHRRANLETADKKKRSAEKDVDDTVERIEKLKARTADLKTNKEYQAQLKEIETAEGEKFRLEDGILEIMELMDTEGATVTEAEGALGAQEAKAEELKRELEAEVKQAEGEIDELRARRTSLTAPIEEDLYEQYMTLLKNSDGLAVTLAQGEVCQGCNMRIMPQLFVRIRRNDELIQCPQCRRFLYFEEKAE